VGLWGSELLRTVLYVAAGVLLATAVLFVIAVIWSLVLR
jgi:hypothetical protein